MKPLDISTAVILSVLCWGRGHSVFAPITHQTQEIHVRLLQNASSLEELDALEDRASIGFAPGANESLSPQICVLTTSMDDLPQDLFSKNQRLQGAILLHFFAAVYFFIILAYICSEYFLPSVECICEDLHLSEDVAAATFMATATSMPEFFTNTISTLVVDSDMGLGTILGSMLFNTLGVAALVGILTKSHVKLDWWPLTRDSIIVMISISSLVSCLWDERVYWYESVVFVVLYVLYFLVMFQNERMKRIATDLIENRWNLCTRLEPKVDDEFTERRRSSRKYSIAVLGEAVNTSLELPPVKKDISRRCSIPVFVPPEEQVAKKMKLLKVSTGSTFSIVWWFFTWPFRILVHFTIPDARVHRKLYPLTFFMCIIWIGGTAYMVFWMMSIIGETFDVPETVMGLTFLAFGGCMPEAVSAVTMIRKGNGAMGVSNSLGANTLAILFSLGLPWFIRNMMEGGASTGAYIEINSYGMQYSVFGLFLAVAILYAVLFASRYTLRKLVGLVLMGGYLLIVSFMILVELDVFFPSENVC